jgi:3-isopropylmalate/(R)-2-methylmalate dehydratase small subunit
VAISGVAWKFGDFISSDLIAPGRYTHLRGNIPEFAKHVLETADPNFAPACQKGDETYIVVAGRNFGQGSSREHAARIIRQAGVPVVLARSFARIFYRNCFNIGLPALTLDTSGIDHGDRLIVDLAGGVVNDATKGTQLRVAPIPDIMLKILEAGGIVEYVQARGDLKL